MKVEVFLKSGKQEIVSALQATNITDSSGTKPYKDYTALPLIATATYSFVGNRTLVVSGEDILTLSFAD